MPRGAADPVGKCRAVEVYTLALVDLRLSVERQVIGVFGDQHLGDGRFSRNATFDQPRGSCRLDDDFLAGPACIFGTTRYQNAELGWHDVELLADVFADPMQAFATAGAVMAFDVDDYIDARQMGRKGTTVCPPLGNPFPAQIEDVQNALKYIRANAARFRIDPGRIASLGMSAGGHLATMVALRDDSTGPDGRVKVAINLDGEHDMTMPPDQVMDNFDNILEWVIGHPAPWSDAELRDISTVTFARPDVSLLTVHGAGDDNVYVRQGERITAALQAAGAETEFVRLEGREGNCHSDCWRVPRAKTAIHHFLDRELNHDANRFQETTRQQGRR